LFIKLKQIYHIQASGATACPASNNKIMTPVVGAFDNYLNNSYLFSPCSVSQFKNSIFAR
jgi:hypothetical protein